MLFKSTTGRNIFAVAACGVFATIAASAVLLYRSIEDTRDNSLERMRQIARAEALATEKNIGGTIHIANSLASVLEAMKQSGNADRSLADQIIQHTVADNPDILGLWTGWEPNAFDGKDADFVNSQGHDATGRYIPYWVRSGGKISNTALVDYATAGPGDYYQLPFTLKKTVVIEPYSYAIDGKEVLITSVAKPVMIDGKPAGLPASISRSRKQAKRFRRCGPWERVSSVWSAVAARSSAIRIRRSWGKALRMVACRPPAGTSSLQNPAWSRK